MALPLIAIVGRPNVGKSMLFNKIIGRRLSIVEDTPGVTRDRIYGESEWVGRKFRLVDTGGIEPNTDSQILAFMREQAQIAIDNADCHHLRHGHQDRPHRLRSGGSRYAPAQPQAHRAGGEQGGLRGRRRSRLLRVLQSGSGRPHRRLRRPRSRHRRPAGRVHQVLPAGGRTRRTTPTWCR